MEKVEKLEKKKRRREGRERINKHITMGQNQVITRQRIIDFPTSSGVSVRASVRMSAAERASTASSAEQANERMSERAVEQASGPVLTSRFLAFLPHCALTFIFSHHFPRISCQLSCDGILNQIVISFKVSAYEGKVAAAAYGAVIRPYPA